MHLSSSLIDDKFSHNIVKVAVEPWAAGEWFQITSHVAK